MTLTAATDLPEGIDRAFNKVKGKLFFKKGAGFLGSLLGQIRFQWTRDVDGAAISPSCLYWNPDVFLKEDEETSITTLAHELWHNALSHHSRRGTRCPDIWNIAGDHVINLLLKEHGYYMGGFPWVMDDKYKKWSTDDIYDDLIASGMKPFAAPSMLILPGDLGHDPSGDGQKTRNQGRDVIESSSNEESAEAMGKVITAYTQSKFTCKPGEVPGEIETVIDKYLNPKLPWNVILFNYFNAMIEEIYSYARPNRRYDDPLMPGLIGREGLENLMFASDISGSITDQQILRFFSEGKSIHDNLCPEMMTFVTFDTEVHDVFRIHKDDPFESFKITGRGGTDLEDLFEFARKENPTALVIFTDLEVNIPENPGIPIIWIVVDNPSAQVPYGQLITFSEDSGARIKQAA